MLSFKERITGISLLFILFTSCAFSQAVKKSSIHWGDTATVRNRSLSNDHKNDTAAGISKANHSSKYGSEYGRLLQLKNGNWLAGYTVFNNAGYRNDKNGGLQLEISLSNDGCKSWHAISVVSDPGRDVDNAALIQLKDGSILLACRSVRWQESYKLPVYKSTDGGVSWKKISVIDSNEGKPAELGKPDKGVYEPHFYLLNDGRLSVMYANEKHVVEKPSYSQVISQKISGDEGKTWGKEIWVAYTPGHPGSRPGMPVYTKMKNGKFIVVYEVCGPEECNIYYKTSGDGINWPVGLGSALPDQTGAPYILSLKDGRLIVTSNRENISISDDYGATWYKTEQPWKHKKDYAEDWKQTIWSALYQNDKNKICIISSVKQNEGQHEVLIRFGEISEK